MAVKHGRATEQPREVGVVKVDPVDVDGAHKTHEERHTHARLQGSRAKAHHALHLHALAGKGQLGTDANRKLHHSPLSRSLHNRAILLALHERAARQQSQGHVGLRSDVPQTLRYDLLEPLSCAQWSAQSQRHERDHT